jgi:beta-galactosidase
VETHRRSFLSQRGLTIEGRGELDLFCGAIDYWRLDRNDWSACLTATRELGVRVVQVAIPWSVHERTAGKHEFGKHRDLGAFLDLVGENGMHAVVCPGPLLGGELTGAGVPARVLERAEMQALTARDTPAWIAMAPRMTPLPSFAAQGFREEIRAWFAAVGAIVGPRRAGGQGGGPVIGVQVGHQAQLVGRLGPFEHDYHPDALRWWHELAGDEAPPRAWDERDPGRASRWLRFREVYLARTLAWLGAALEDAGMGEIARLHDLPWSEPGAFDLPGAQAALGPGSAVGMDVGHRPADGPSLRRRALYLVGSATPLPMAVHVAVGGPALGVPVPTGAEDAARRTLLGLLAAGVRGFGLTMAVERSRWYGAPISEVGEPQHAASWLGRVLAALAEVGWTSLRREVPVAVLVSRAERRFGQASSAAGALAPMIEALAPGAPVGSAMARDAGAIAHERWLDAVERALCWAQIPYLLVDEACSLDAMARFRLLVAPTGARVDRDTWQRLHALSARGVIVVIGPERPVRDEHDTPLGEAAALPPRVGLIRAGSADDDASIQGLADDLAAVAGDLADAWITAEQTDIDCSLYADADGMPQVLFVGNRRADERIADVIVPEGSVLVDVLTDEELGADADGIVDVPVGPYEVRMFFVD